MNGDLNKPAGSSSAGQQGSTADLTGQIKDDVQAAREAVAGDLSGVKSTVADLGRDAKSKLSELGQQAKDTVKGLQDDERVSALKEQVTGQISDVKEQARSFAEQQKDLVGDQLRSVGGALRSAADQLEDGRQPTIAGHVRSFADNLDNWAETVRGKDLGEIVSVVQDFGRRRPGALLGLAAVAGFAASRFVMASARSNAGDGSYGGTDDRSGGWQPSGNPEFGSGGPATSSAASNPEFPGAEARGGASPTTPLGGSFAGGA